MQEVASAELREHLGAYLERVAAGERFRVTEEGRVVALLMPAVSADSLRERLIAEGRLIPAVGDLLDVEPLQVPSRMSTAEALDLEREERLT